MKVYVTRDEDDLTVWVWKKPSKGNWAPSKLKGCDSVIWQRGELENADCYLATDFKTKFGTSVREKTKKCVHLDDKLVESEDYKLFSKDPERRR